MEFAAEALSPEAWHWFSLGLGIAFITTIGIIVLFVYTGDRGEASIDQGFLGLILLLTSIFYLIGFSFLVAASTKGVDIKLMVAAVDGVVLLGGKLLAPNFLRYLNDEPIDGPRVAKLKGGQVG
jgi:hypothetical protein